MDYRFFIFSISLILSSCQVAITPGSSELPILPTIMPTGTSYPTARPIPSPTLYSIDPTHIPTPINTPHIVPTPLSQEIPDNQFDLNLFLEKRYAFYENSLQFTIVISDIHYWREGGDRYILIVDGKLTNISNQPVVVKKKLSIGFAVREEVSLELSYNDNDLKYNFCCIETETDFSQDDFIILQPREFQNYSFAFEVPIELYDDEDQDIKLSGKKIKITANYLGTEVGFQDNSIAKNHYIDMNAWVGFIHSNSVEHVFP